jgi:hypothetical protein
MARKDDAFDVDLTREEIAHLAEWHKECETRCAQMREYGLAEAHKQRQYLFAGLMKTGKYMSGAGVTKVSV